MENGVKNKPFLARLTPENGNGLPYRRCVVLSELQTPCFPLVCRMILPDPLMIEHVSKIQTKLFLCISYSSVLPCLDMLEKYAEKSKTDSNLKPFVDYQGAITLLTFNNFFSENSKIENGEFVFYVDSMKFVLNQHTCRKIVDLVNPSLSTIPCEQLKLVDWRSWGSRKTERMNARYEDYYANLTDCNSTNLVKTVHKALYFDKGDDLPAIDLSGLGFGESLTERAEMVRSLLRTSKEDKLRIIQLKTGTPLEVLHAVLLGVDIVVTPYPEILAMNGKAVYFNIPEETKCEFDVEHVLRMLSENCHCVGGVYEDCTNEYIDLRESVYSEEFDRRLHEESVMDESRAYVNHLLVCKEMSANLILSSHNLGMYELLFKKVRDSIENNTLVGFVYNFIKLNAK